MCFSSTMSLNLNHCQEAILTYIMNSTTHEQVLLITVIITIIKYCISSQLHVCSLTWSCMPQCSKPQVTDYLSKNTCPIRDMSSACIIIYLPSIWSRFKIRKMFSEIQSTRHVRYKISYMPPKVYEVKHDGMLWKLH